MVLAQMVLAMNKVSGIFVMLILALVLGTLASVQARAEPTSLPISGDASTGPFNPNHPRDEPAAHSRRV
jgi:hypothetical protein